MMQTTGLKGLLYKYFRQKEKKLYSLSDHIGCMSQANVNYILKHNPEISKEKVEICPNCIEVQDMRLSEQERKEMRDKYGLPQDKKIFVYGGNLGKPQDVPFIINCLKKCTDLVDVYFVIAGSGTERHLIEKYLTEENPSHVKLFGQIPKDEYDKMIACCDVGLIFLDHRFTIPNFPSRLLSYMQAGLPVLACTDPNTDIGKVITDGGFGWFYESYDVTTFADIEKKIVATHTKEYGNRAFDYLKSHYISEISYKIITKEEV
jgi:glycosyltransferase involved in cell wall biosynthesis